jgi:hypothetical protein
MYILLSLSQDKALARLEEPDDCTRFHVAIRDLSEKQVQQLLQKENLGEFADYNTAWVQLTAIRKLAEGRIAPDWSDRFEKMLDYARRKGWLSQDGTLVSGHCEWV